MRYVGSKNRLSKELVPIIQSYIKEDTVGYIEPFVGGANIIDKIQHPNRIGCDIHKELIELLKYSQNNELPVTITEEEYNRVKNNKQIYKEWYVGLVGFCATFCTRYFGGYARAKKPDGTKEDVPKGRIENLRRQSQKENFKNIKFYCCDFLKLPKEKIKKYVIYCDIPYKDTLQYKTDAFPYEEFYKWAKEMSKNNIVLISEYNMPEEFECIWEKKISTLIGLGVNENSNRTRIERLYKPK